MLFGDLFGARTLFICLRFNLKSHFIDGNFALFKREDASAHWHAKINI